MSGGLMQTRRFVFVVADISGYTTFAHLHRLSQAHAESIICELLDAVITHTAYPLTLNELLGDAAFFYAPSDETEDVAHDVFAQVRRFTAAFASRSLELTGGCRMCVCDACRTAGTLRLKVIVHEGEAVITRLRGFEKLAGEDVIITHRLLKNSILDNEYIAATDSFMRLLGVTDEQPELRHEHCQGIGEIGLAVFRPHPAEQTNQPIRATAAIANALRMDLYAARRILLRSAKRRPRQSG
jgi:Protein of unknown function (DUF2652)